LKPIVKIPSNRGHAQRRVFPAKLFPAKSLPVSVGFNKWTACWLAGWLAGGRLAAQQTNPLTPPEMQPKFMPMNKHAGKK
jgi:hypothetical protein